MTEEQVEQLAQGEKLDLDQNEINMMVSTATQNKKDPLDKEELIEKIKNGNKNLTKRELKAMLNGDLDLTEKEIKEIAAANGLELDDA